MLKKLNALMMGITNFQDIALKCSLADAVEIGIPEMMFNSLTETESDGLYVDVTVTYYRSENHNYTSTDRYRLKYIPSTGEFVGTLYCFGRILRLPYIAIFNVISMYLDDTEKDTYIQRDGFILRVVGYGANRK